MPKSLRELLIERASNKQAFRRARNKSMFLSLWPEIREMLDEGWSLLAISDVIKAHGLLDFQYGSLRRYTMRQRALEGHVKEASTPKKNTSALKRTEKEKTAVEDRAEAETTDTAPPSYSVPPQFGRYSREDDEKLF